MWLTTITHHFLFLQESDGHCSDLTKRISTIGASGRHPQNCERDLFRILELALDLGLNFWNQPWKFKCALCWNQIWKWYLDKGWWLLLASRMLSPSIGTLVVHILNSIDIRIHTLSRSLWKTWPTLRRKRKRPCDYQCFCHMNSWIGYMNPGFGKYVYVFSFCLINFQKYIYIVGDIRECFVW